MAPALYESNLDELHELDLHAASAEVVTWQGRRALRLEGLALLPTPPLAAARIEAEIGTEGPAYPGIAFRVVDSLNYELAYAVPHCSGLWDAIQYDPVFHGSNTWQLHHGAAYQKEAQVPTGAWFRLRVDVQGSRAAIQVGDQPALLVERLARHKRRGRIGLWTFRPAHFARLRVLPGPALPPAERGAQRIPRGRIREWFLEGWGTARCERSGILNLNRYLPLALGEARLSRCFELPRADDVEISFGFSDVLKLELDGQEVFAGENRFAGFADRAARGYVEPEAHRVLRRLSAGVHRLHAVLRVEEGFGWGLAASLHAGRVRWLPAEES